MPHKPKKFKIIEKSQLDEKVSRELVSAKKLLNEVGHNAFRVILRTKIYPG